MRPAIIRETGGEEIPKDVRMPVVLMGILLQQNFGFLQGKILLGP